MTDIRDVISRLNDQDKQKFLEIRNSLRKAYLSAVINTVGIEGYTHDDCTFMDAIDIKVEMLMTRAGISTPNNPNNREMITPISDPFAIITRPVTAGKAFVDEKAIEAAANGWTNK